MAVDSGAVIPSCVYPPSGLAEFILCRRWHAEPEPGDVVFYSFSSVQTDPFGMPHVGIVIDTDAWKKDKCFVAVEGGVDGTVVRTFRDRLVTIGFGRPDFKFRLGGGPKMQTGLVYVDPENVYIGGRGRDVMNVQLALEKMVGLHDHVPGVFDETTRRAFARWQRVIGYVGVLADGTPSPGAVSQLGYRSDVFTTAPAKN